MVPMTLSRASEAARTSTDGHGRRAMTEEKDDDVI